MIAATSAAALIPLLTGGSPSLAQRSIDGAKLPILAGGEFATATSKLARQRGKSPALTNFAALEIEEQAAVAEAFGSRPGTVSLTEKNARMLQLLEAAPADEFDAMYVRGQMTGHQELLALHESYASRGADPMAQGASMVAVPSIKTHLAILKGIRASMA